MTIKYEKREKHCLKSEKKANASYQHETKNGLVKGKFFRSREMNSST